MKKCIFLKLSILLLSTCLIILILNYTYAITNIVSNEEITITVDNEGDATMVTQNTDDYLKNPYKGFCADDTPVLKEGNILTSKIGYDEYWNERNGSLATEGYARFNWYQFYDNTFLKPNNTRDYNDNAYNWDVLKNFIIVCAKNGVDARLGVMTANTTGTDSAYGKTDDYSLSKLQEHVMPAGSIMPDGTIVKEGETVYKPRNATPMWIFEGIPVGYDDTNNEYIYDVDNDVEYYLDNKELQWVPKWDDKNLTKNIDDFVYCLSEYLKNEEYEGKKLIDYISFIEVRSYGNYGENHLTGINDNVKFICGDLDLSKYPSYTYVEPTDCYVTNDRGETYNVYESTLFNGKTRYSLNISAEYYYDNYLTTYLNAFKDTNVGIVINWAAIWDSTYTSEEGYKPNGRLRKWIEDNNGYLTIRSDSVFANSFGEATQLYVSNGVAPSAFEYVFNTYKKKLENDNEAIKNNITKDLIQVIQNGRITYMDFSNDLYSYYVDNFEDYESEIAKFGNTLGYYFRLKQAEYNTDIVIDKENNLNIDLFFVNEGVNKLYDKGDSKVYIALLETDSNGNVLYDEFNRTKVVAKYLTDINPTEWNSNLVSTNEILDASNSNNWIKESLNVTVEDVTPGNYMLAVGLFTDYESDKPSIKLGNTGATLDDWYTLGMVEIIVPIGDVNEDGKVNINDWNRMYNHINEISELIDEEFERGDLNKDGKVNIKDWNRIYDHITKVDLLPAQILELGTGKLTITPNVTEAHPGDKITYTVKMSAVENLAGMKFKLVIPEGLTFIEGKEVDGLQEALNAAKAEFTESTKIFVVGSSNYTSRTDTTLMTFKCSVNDGVTGDKEITFIIDEDDIFDTTDDMNNIPVDYSNPGSKVKITIPSTGISLNKTTLSLERGTSETLIATILPQETTDIVTWESSDETKAIVDANGKVTAVAGGTAIIIAKTTSSKKATCTVTVQKATPQYIIPTGLKAIEGQTLSEIKLSTGFEWMDETQVIEGVGNLAYKAKYIPEDTTNYEIVENIEIDINVTRRTISDVKIYGAQKQYKAFEKVNTQNMYVVVIYNNGKTEEIRNNITIKYKNAADGFRYGDTFFCVKTFDTKGTLIERNVSVTVVKATSSYTVPTGLEAISGQKLSQIKLPEGFKWKDETQVISGLGSIGYKARYIPKDTINYETIENIEIKINVKSSIGSKYVGNINSELITFNVGKNQSGATYVSGQVVVVEWVNGKSTVPKVAPKMKFKSTDEKVELEVFVTPTGTNTYYFDRFIEGIDTSKQYFFEIESGDVNNVSPNKKMNVYFTQTKYNNTIVGKYKDKNIRLLKQNIIFEKDTYIGNINSELKAFNVGKNQSGATYVSGQVVVVEWVNGKSTVPKVAPKMKFKSTDGKVELEVFVTPTGTNTYYFDRFIEGIDTSKQYYFEIASGDSRNISENRKMNVYFTNTKYNNTIVGKYKDKNIRLLKQNIVFEKDTYIGNINSELITFNVGKNQSGATYVSGQIVVVEWINGKSTVPKVAPKMKFKSTDGKVELEVFVTPTGTNTYYFDRFIEGIDTSKQYYFEIASGDSRNISENRKMNVYFTNTKYNNTIVGRYKNTNIRLLNQNIIFEK